MSSSGQSAILVCSPRLLETRGHSIEEMQLVNALYRLVEYAEGNRGQKGRTS